MQHRAISAVKLLLFLAAFLLAAVTQAATPLIKTPANTPQRVLFVGNSYFYYNASLHFHARRIALAADPVWAKPFIYKSATIAAAPLAHHNIDYLTTPGNLGVKDPFDMVILQGNSTDALKDKSRASFREKVIEFNKIITARGAMTALYMTQAHVKPSKWASPEMMRKTEDMYVEVGNETGALVIPAGLAFEEAYRQRPDIKLHQDYDGSHPTMLGTYLAACTVYATLYGKSPEGNAYDFHGIVGKEDAAFLQRVANETVKKFFGR
ncbi:MAG: hypothetical protein K2X06_17055 [Burkholderiales bacterium]|nr:hypothetical protein [Burkholderiales bacterium]